MEYKTIKLSLSDLYDYLLGIQDGMIESSQINDLIHDLSTFLTTLHLDPQVSSYRYKDEISILMEINEGLFDLLDDYEDLEDDQFIEHIEEYKTIQNINSRIIDYLNDSSIVS